MGNWQLERLLLNHFANAATLEALGANHQCLVSTVWQRATNTLQVWLELTASNTSHFGTHTTQILRLTASFNLIAHRSGFTANVTCASHGTASTSKTIIQVVEYIDPTAPGNLNSTTCFAKVAPESAKTLHKVPTK
jgi:hypothetical protein